MFMRSMRRLLIVMSAAMIAACQAAAPPPLPTPENEGISRAAASNLAIIEWVRSPENIIFRADVEGGYAADSIRGKRDVPNCTIYGDARVVWVNELDPFRREVLYDRLAPAVIADYIAYLTINERIYTFATPTAAVPVYDAVVETIRINVNGIDQRTDGFSGWDGDDDWFRRVLAACRSLSGTPILFEPTNGWMSAIEVPYVQENPALTWDVAVTGLDLGESAALDTPLWVTGAAAVQIWRAQNDQPSRFVFQQGERYFQVALQVPGISRNSPSAP